MPISELTEPGGHIYPWYLGCVGANFTVSVTVYCICRWEKNKEFIIRTVNLCHFLTVMKHGVSVERKNLSCQNGNQLQYVGSVVHYSKCHCMSNHWKFYRSIARSGVQQEYIKALYNWYFVRIIGGSPHLGPIIWKISFHYMVSTSLGTFKHDPAIFFFQNTGIILGMGSANLVSVYWTSGHIYLHIIPY